MTDSIVGGICGIFLLIFIIYAVVKHKKNLNSIEKKEEELKTLDICETKKMEGDSYTIVIDDKNKKFAITTDRQENYHIYKYSDFIDCEIIENDGTENKTSGNAGKVIVGGVMFGGLGALAGMSGGRKTKSTKVIYSLSVRILVNDIKTPFYQIDILDRQCKANSSEYKEAIQEIGEIVSTFNLIKRNKK